VKPHLHPIILVVVLAVSGLPVHDASAGADTAREDFMILCADCHNSNAKGKGPLSKNLTNAPPDLTRIRQRSQGKFDREAVYDWIIGLKMSDSHGSREMPIWGDWLMDEAVEDETSLDGAKDAEREVRRRVMDMVKYLETLQVDDP
jgi:mono/diheme cytochrome c family protein